MTIFYKIISESEALFSLKDGEIIKSTHNTQNSYNLPRNFFKYVTENNILNKDPYIKYKRKHIDDDAYILQKDYEFKLGSTVLLLIGDEYDNSENEFIASLNGTNNKFQIYRTVYGDLGWQYSWFVELYDKNLSGNKLILDIDEINKVFTIDIEFTSINQNSYLEFIENFEF